MTKRFDIPCNFNGRMIPVTLYIGDPKLENHPLHFQSNWLSNTKGGQIPQDVMDSIAKIRDLAVRNNVSFEDLCYFAVKKANGTLTKKDDNEQFDMLLSNIDNNEDNGNNQIEN